MKLPVPLFVLPLAMMIGCTSVARKTSQPTSAEESDFRFGLLSVEGHEAAATLRSSPQHVTAVVLEIGVRDDDLWRATNRFRASIRFSDDSLFEGNLRLTPSWASGGWHSQRYALDLPVMVSPQAVQEMTIYVDDRPRVFKRGEPASGANRR